MDATPAARSTANELIGSSLQAGKTVRLTVPTKSMLPTLAPGDQITARAFRGEEPRVGDIALGWNGSVWLAHRLIVRRLNGNSPVYMTQGDNCVEPDTLWSDGQICARIIMVERKGKVANLESRRRELTGSAIAWLLRIQSAVALERPWMQRVFKVAIRTSAQLGR